MVPCQNSDFDSKSLGEYYFSAPTSPSPHPAVPFAWEEKPGTPKPAADGDDFVFDVSQEWDTASLSAEDLFDGGVIKPMITPPPAEMIIESLTSPPRQTRKVIQKVVTGKQVVARSQRQRQGGEKEMYVNQGLRGRFLRYEIEINICGRKRRKINGIKERVLIQRKEQKKWTLMDFFADREPLKKYTTAALMQRGQVSAHELHYTVNRALSEDLKRKTFLPG